MSSTSSTSLTSFISLTIPSAVGLLISINLGNLISVFQSSIVNPTISLVPGANLDNLRFIARKDPEVVFHIGRLLSALITFLIVCFIAYIAVKIIYKTTKLDATRKM